VTRPRLSRHGCFLMIHLFLDDSGKEGQSTNPWVCMAGYVADYEPYIALIGKWRQLLAVHGIKELHMKHLIPLDGPYRNLGWDYPKRDAVITDFINAINATPIEVDPIRWTGNGAS
jgi:hypothetical protein